MKREIEFRGKRNKDGKWHYGNLLYESSNNHYWIVEFDDTFDIEQPKLESQFGVDAIDIIQGTQGQYTGLKDKNGIKIFEGDILKGQTDDYIDRFSSPVDFYAGSFHITIFYDLLAIPLSGFETVWVKNGCKGDEETSLWIAEFEVIGNIHEPLPKNKTQ